MTISANDPSRKSWVNVTENSDFPIQNLPFGIFSKEGISPRTGVALGDQVIDLSALHSNGFLNELPFGKEDLTSAVLNDMMKHGKQAFRDLRDRIADIFDANGNYVDRKSEIESSLHSQDSVAMHLPVHVGDYTDFYSSIEHATNVGTMFRDPNNALLPNWKHIPVAYHGRSSSIILSGEEIRRPKGQTRPNDNEPPVYGPSRLLDFELEMAFITFEGKPLGNSISTSEAEDYIFGMVLFNDWSARDIQKWEYVPLGPFLAKNFASSISPWIVTLDALEPFRTPGPDQDPKVLPYLEYKGEKNIDINLEVAIESAAGSEKTVCNSNYKNMYWNMNQQLAHHTVNGCNVRCGDMMASGTISGSDPSSYGSMLEITWRGTKPVSMPDGTERKFINDGDSVIMRGHCKKSGVRVGFGEVKTKVLPAE
ncbi:MAG: fumarylacetoacetase [Flavobacteriales bacterium]|nr:fumarylacetoacetase [Flavobacteriales bacterium]